MFVNKYFQTLQVFNLGFPMIKNGKFSGYYFYVNTNIWGDFQICISAPLSLTAGHIHKYQTHF